MERTYLWIFDDMADTLNLVEKLENWIKDEDSPLSKEERKNIKVKQYNFSNAENNQGFKEILDNDKKKIVAEIEGLLNDEGNTKIIVLLDFKLYAGSNSTEYSKQRRELVVRTLREALNKCKSQVDIFIFLYTTVEHDNLENYIYANEKELAKGFIEMEVLDNFKVYDRGVSFDFSNSSFYYGRLDVVYNASKKTGGDIWLKA